VTVNSVPMPVVGLPISSAGVSPSPKMWGGYAWRAQSAGLQWEAGGERGRGKAALMLKTF